MGMQFLDFGDAGAVPAALRTGENAALAPGPGNLPAGRQHTRRVSGIAEKTAGTEEFSASRARDRGAACAPAAEELHRRHPMGAAAAFPALLEGGGAAPREAARRPPAARGRGRRPIQGATTG